MKNKKFFLILFILLLSQCRFNLPVVKDVVINLGVWNMHEEFEKTVNILNLKKAVYRKIIVTIFSDATNIYDYINEGGKIECDEINNKLILRHTNESLFSYDCTLYTEECFTFHRGNRGYIEIIYVVWE